jgi:hypothetical protein
MNPIVFSPYFSLISSKAFSSSIVLSLSSIHHLLRSSIVSSLVNFYPLLIVFLTMSKYYTDIFLLQAYSLFFLQTVRFSKFSYFRVFEVLLCQLPQLHLAQQRYQAVEKLENQKLKKSLLDL